CCQPHVDCARGQISRFQVDSIPQHDGPIERKPRFRTVPLNEYVNGVPVTTLGIRGSKAANYRGLGLIKIWEGQSCFRSPALSALLLSSHVQPPPKRLDRRIANGPSKTLNRQKNRNPKSVVRDTDYTSTERKQRSQPRSPEGSLNRISGGRERRYIHS